MTKKKSEGNETKKARTMSNKARRHEKRLEAESENRKRLKQGLLKPHEAKKLRKQSAWIDAGKPSAPRTEYGNIAIQKTVTDHTGAKPKKTAVTIGVKPCCSGKSYRKCNHFHERFPLALTYNKNFMFTRDAHISAALMKS